MHEAEALDAGGLFAVRHKPDRDRLIYDRRPRNSKERRFGWARLPSGSQWAQIVLSENCCLRACADDLSTYFYCLRQVPRSWAFNLLGRRRPGRAWRAAGLAVADEDLEQEMGEVCDPLQDPWDRG